MTSTYVCTICKAVVPNDDHQHLHVLQAVIFEGSPLAFTVSAQSHYDNPSATALLLGEARRELKEFFPDKEFEIQPGRFMLRKDKENMVILGEAYVATFLVFEK